VKKSVKLSTYRFAVTLAALLGFAAGWHLGSRQWLIPYVIIAACVGGMAVGALWMSQRVRLWRERWIESEHDRAGLLGERPRDIEEVYPWKEDM